MKYLRILVILAISFLITAQLFGQEVDVDNDFLNQYREKTDLIIDRNIYLAGEKLWFSAWVKSNLDTVYSKTIYIELYNGEKRIQRKYSIEEGYCKGFITIPKDYVSSGFVLRAYTLYQRNSLPENYAYQILYVVNTESGIPSDNQPQPDVQKDTLSIVSTNNSYNITIDNNAEKRELNVTENREKYSVIYNSEYSGKPESGIRYIIRNSDFAIVKNEELIKKKFSIPKYQLTEGYNYYLIYRDKTPLAFGIIYKPVIFKTEFIEKEKIRAKTRSKLKLSDLVDNKSSSNVLSITRKGSRFSLKDSTIAYQMLVYNPYLLKSLNNIFPGLKSIPSKYVRKALRNHTLAMKSDRKLLARLLDKSSNYLPEIFDLSIRGTVKNNNGTPVANELIYLSIFDSHSQLHLYKTLDDGTFIFNIENMVDIRNAYLTMDSLKTGSVDILIENNFSNDFYSEYIPFIIDTGYLEMLKDMNLAYQVRNSYSVKDTSYSHSFNPIPPIDMHGEHIFLKDYIELPSVIDVFREIIPKASVRTRKNKHFFTVTDDLRMFVYDYPLILLDNIPLFNYKEILSLNPNKVEKISVVNQPVYLGDYKIEGIIALKTYKGDFGDINFSGNSTFLKYQTYTPSAKFIQQIPRANNLPHFSNTLFWKVGNLNLNNLIIDIDDGNGEYEVLIYDIRNGVESDYVYHSDLEVVIDGE